MSYRYVSNDGNAYIDDDDKTYRVVWGGYDDESARIVEAEKSGERGRFIEIDWRLYLMTEVTSVRRLFVKAVGKAGFFLPSLFLFFIKRNYERTMS